MTAIERWGAGAPGRSRAVAFDPLVWIGPDPAARPERACLGADLAPGLLIEIIAVAAREGALR